MSLIKTYDVTISNFAGLAPCDGFYIYTGLTTDINDASYINGVGNLTTISTPTYTFQVDVVSTVTLIYVFIQHCDEVSYKMSAVDLRCSDCVMIASSPTPTPTITPTLTVTPTNTPTPTHTPAGSPMSTPTITPTPSISYKSWNIIGCTNTCSGGILTCTGTYSVTVYTLPSVTAITDPSITIYTNTSLTTTFSGFFQQGDIYDAITGSPSDLGAPGGPC